MTASTATATTTVKLPDGTVYEQPTGVFVGGRFQPVHDQSTFETVDPYTHKVICSVARGKAQDVDVAVDAAKAAFPGWRATPPQQRGQLIQKLADLIRRDADILAKIEVSMGW